MNSNDGRKPINSKNNGSVPAYGSGRRKEDMTFEPRSAGQGEKKKRKGKLTKAKKRKIAIIVLSILIVILTAVLILGIWYTNSIFKDINHDDSLQVNEDDDFGLYDENLSFRTMYDITDFSSYSDYLVKWSNNGGELIHSKNVTNVLLVGEDGDATDTQNGRSDCIMIASINRKDKKIVLTSVMRDCYCCFDTDNGRQFGKINSSCFLAGYGGLIKTVENFFKIDIDYYISVNFNSFPKLINALGGVTVPVQQYEAEYINSTTVHTIEYGDNVKLDGWEALVFCRIRHCDADSDVSRTRRQRTLISAMIDSAKNASKGQLLNAIKVASPYIKTNMTNNLLIKFGTAGLTQNWMSYKMENLTIPDQETGIDSTIDGQSCWTVDYPVAAQKIQKQIYGITNIVISQNHPTLSDLRNYSMGYSGTHDDYSAVSPDSYDEDPTYVLSYDNSTTSPSYDYGGDDSTQAVTQPSYEEEPSEYTQPDVPEVTEGSDEGSSAEQG